MMNDRLNQYFNRYNYWGGSLQLCQLYHLWKVIQVPKRNLYAIVKALQHYTMPVEFNMTW